jgi:sugar lactone lactonase YvrE
MGDAPQKHRVSMSFMKTLFFCFVSGLLLVATSRVHSQTFSFTTLAGSASIGSADGTGAAARFSSPSGVASDNQGSIYVTDSGNNTIRKITSGGTVTTIAGQIGVKGSADGTGTNASFNLPNGIAVDANGNLYVADEFNDTIRKITPAGTNWVVSTLAGQVGMAGLINAMGTNAQFATPTGIAVDGAGNVYVADVANDVIRQITPAGLVSTIAGQPHHPGSADGTNNAAQFYMPFGITVDATTNLYVTDSINETVRKLVPGGTNWVISTIAGQVTNAGSADGMGTNAQFNGPAGIAVNSGTNLFVADDNNYTIRKTTLTGTNWAVSTFAGLVGVYGDADGATNNARFHSPIGVAVDGTGNVYVADANNNEIRKITPGGVVSTFAGVSTGSTDGPGTNALFWSTAAVTLDAQNNVYVADYYNCTIRKIATNGVVSTIAGLAGNIGSADGTNGDARFYYPSDIALDSGGSLYVADAYNSTIRRVTPVGTNWVTSTIAGQAGFYGVVDGVGSNAFFYVPAGIAVDANTNVFVSDNYGMVIRKVTPVGTNWAVTTIAGLPYTSGSSNGTGTNAMFYFPRGIAVDNASNVYVADSENNSIRRLTPVGTNWLVNTLAGVASVRGSADGTGTNAEFYFPDDVTLDAVGHLYVMDTYNQTIRKMTLVGTNWVVTTVAGQVGVTGSTDGLGTNALFNYAQSVAFDNAGNLYVADTHNSTIRLGRAIIPSLQIAPAVNYQVILSWPTWAYSFVLETSSTVSSGAVWTPLTNGVVTLGNNFVLTNNVSGSNAFYRLHGQ